MKVLLLVALALVACTMAAEEPERVKKDTLLGLPYGLGYARTVLPGMTAYTGAYPYAYNYGAYPYSSYNYGAYPYAYNTGAYPYSSYYGSYPYNVAGRTIVY